MKKLIKNEEYQVEIIDNGIDGEGIAKIDDVTVFIPGLIKGEKAKIKIVKVLSSYAYGIVLEIIEKSPKRIEVDCKTYKRCGGCNLRHIDYEETLAIKQEKVQNLVNKMLKNKIKVNKTIGMKEPFHYRNKAQYPVGINKEGKPEIGVFANRTHEIIPMKKCLIQNESSEEIANFVFKFWCDNNLSIYNENTRKGLLRHIVIKNGIKTNEIMVVLVLNGEGFEKENELVKAVTEKYANVKTIVKNINTKNTNVILGNRNINIYGSGIICDKLGEFIFKISPLSFYQVNPIQAEILYNLGVKAANLTKNDTVFDLYCGIGTISIFMAKYAKKVYGVEIVPEAIDMAKENATLNDVQNAEFIAGDVELVLDDLINNQKVIPDVVMVDPPRKGLDTTSLNNILKISPDRLVYISCNPATLVRDLSVLEEKYSISSIQPVDMFPWTSHVECV
ncbi:MAG: 23S rRNA (uracil(1939)-C(5))-methyltransferase RlmD, partial [Clostridia bacterium]|nr:23S rRNA (uracil(1939)-C(5))-methyltransferase RlmD [Clostridia bacterium]